MKRVTIALASAVLIFLATGCFNEIENDLGMLERRISTLEQKCSQLNTNVESLRKIVETVQGYDFVTGVVTHRGMDNSITGYTINFYHSSPITLYTGTDADTPVVGVQYNYTDGLYYWTITFPSSGRTEYITNNFGQRVPATAASPIFKIENGNWLISYDQGDIWHNMGKATGEAGVSFVKNVVSAGDFIQFNFLDNTSIKLPTWASYQALVSSMEKAESNMKTLNTLYEALTKKVYAADVIPLIEGSETIGYKIVLSDGTEMPFYNGVADNVPELGASRDPKNPSDPAFYWTVKYPGAAGPEWILADGAKIRAEASDGVEVKLDFYQYDGIYYWAVRYGNNEPEPLIYKGTMVRASATAPEAVISNVQVTPSEVTITTAKGVTVSIPRYPEIQVTFSSPVRNNCEINMFAGSSAAFLCTIGETTENYSILVTGSEGFSVSEIPSGNDGWVIMVQSPDTMKHGEKGAINLIISDGRGNMKNCVITVICN